MLDPERNTPSLLAYAAAFNPSFRALRPANASQLRQMANGFHLIYERYRGRPPATTR
ncbi:hypothetical protein [Paraburkholderia hospita]|uniref:hypothetical protein n=1 Tax=Paraburkholderia hospita TaxID=169430 RepID=UPI001F606C75|nr:hypothetical protein [Paraburkholderia hospita]